VPEQSALDPHSTHAFATQWGITVGQSAPLTHWTQPGGVFGAVQTTGGGAPPSRPPPLLPVPLLPVLLLLVPLLPLDPDELPVPELLAIPEPLLPPDPELVVPVASPALASCAAPLEPPLQFVSPTSNAAGANSAAEPMSRLCLMHLSKIMGAPILLSRI
jgi:hypothetical protein